MNLINPLAPSNFTNTPDIIEQKTDAIYRRILAESKTLKTGNFERIATADLERLFDLYDHYFFNGFFRANFDGKISFRLSQRMTRAGGKLEHNKERTNFCIVLSTALIFQTFHDVKR